MAGTDVVARSTLDLTRAPDTQWNDAMVRMVSNQLFRGREVTKGELYYCLSIAEGLALNPLIGEIYFISSKSVDGKGPALTPYVGRNGLVNKASACGCYFESDTVHENDRFRYTRRRDGSVDVTHSYGSQDRGEIVGAYAFLHDDDGKRKPAFFYAKLSEYLPTFDQEWKMAKSPWGNQRSAMTEKCAMIGAGRKRLNLGNVLIDGEVARYQQMGDVVAFPAEDADAEFDWSQLESVGEEIVTRLRERVEQVNELVPLSWPTAKLEMLLSGAGEQAVRETLERVERDIAAVEPRSTPTEPAHESEPEPEPESDEEEATDAVVVEPPDPKQIASLREQAAVLEKKMYAMEESSDEWQRASDELTRVDAELAALEDPNQTKLDLGGDG